ncbi:hypothetical protein HY497_00765 [Candidatus Woesearchaeota archaeon]|nr:hypothetical protein [Candidatus Woesearchaeota archaeon]
MPHQCVRCNTFYEDGDDAVLKGCACGGKLFFFIKKSHIDEARKLIVNLSEDEKVQMEHDVFDLVGVKQEEEKPVVLEFESISVLQPGKYHLDLVNLFKKEPLIIKVGDGKYLLDLSETFRQGKEGKLK